MSAAKRPKVTIYRARDGWRWRLKAKNGRIIADSGEAYARKWNAIRAEKRAYMAFFEAYVEVQDE